MKNCLRSEDEVNFLRREEEERKKKKEIFPDEITWIT